MINRKLTVVIALLGSELVSDVARKLDQEKSVGWIVFDMCIVRRIHTVDYVIPSSCLKKIH